MGRSHQDFFLACSLFPPAVCFRLRRSPNGTTQHCWTCCWRAFFLLRPQLPSPKGSLLSLLCTKKQTGLHCTNCGCIAMTSSIHAPCGRGQCAATATGRNHRIRHSLQSSHRLSSSLSSCSKCCFRKHTAAIKPGHDLPSLGLTCC